MTELRLQTGPAQDKHVRGDFLFLRLGFSDDEITVTIGPDGPGVMRHVAPLWSHTVFELENLAMGLRAAALGRIPAYKVPSRDMLIGPMVHFRTALRFELGHPGIGNGGPSVGICCQAFTRPKSGRHVVYIEAVLENRTEHVWAETQEVLAFAEEVYALAKAIAPHLVKWGDDEDALDAEK